MDTKERLKKIPRVLLTIETSRTFGRNLLRGIARYTSIHRPWLTIMEPPFYKKNINHEDWISRLRKMDIDGIITREPSKYNALVKNRVPTIIVMHLEDAHAKIPHIIVDFKAIVELAIEHLNGKGFKNFAFCGFSELSWSKNYEQCFTDSVKSVGGKCFIYDSLEFKSSNSLKQEMDDLTQWLKLLPKPVGLMACNDDRARTIIELSKLAEVHVPEEVAVIGVDNDELLCELAAPPLSSIALNGEHAGYEAAELLDTLMSGKKIPTKTIKIAPTYIVVRQSSDIFASEDDELVHALKYINENFRSLITVDEIADKAAISRRGLLKKFKKDLGRSIFDEIVRVRINYMIKLLIETNLSISLIAQNIGYSDYKKFSRFFKKHTNYSPREYRNLYGTK